MGVEMFTTYCVCCDRCGCAAARDYGKSTATIAEARMQAQQQGFRIADWLQDGCPRQTMFCPRCVAELLEKEARCEAPH